MNIDADILDKKLASQIQQYIKRVKLCDQVEFITVMQDYLYVGVTHHVNRTKFKIMIILINAVKNIW